MRIDIEGYERGLLTEWLDLPSRNLPPGSSPLDRVLQLGMEFHMAEAHVAMYARALSALTARLVFMEHLLYSCNQLILMHTA